MVLIYMIASICFGVWTDKGSVDRRMLLVGGILFWSLATALAGLATNLPQLVLFRSLVMLASTIYAADL